MACPTCGHTMQSVVDRIWWCPRCGTTKVGDRHDGAATYIPALVERVVRYFEAASDEDRQQARRAIEESIHE